MNAESASLVLVIEDDPDMRMLLTLMLEGQGYRTLSAANGREGLDVVSRCDPDLILLDMKMPVMDGWEFARQYRSAYADRAPIVVLTAAEDARSRASEIGAEGWLEKPVDLELLYATVERWTRPGGVSAATGTRSSPPPDSHPS